jgi:peptidoglycan/xylan/chitin deacetylase (PgdA/CDA1 family)
VKLPWLRPLRLAALNALGRPLILLYHRIAPAGFDPWALCVSPRHFEQHLHVLKQHKVVLSLAELVEGMRAGRAPRHAVAITFDDGYADNLHCARPILEAYDLPATFFLTMANIIHQREYWWDELGRIVMETPTLPAEVTLAPEGHRERCRAPSGRDARAKLYRMLWTRLRVLGYEEREHCLDKLAAWAGLDRTPRDTHRPLRTDEVIELSESGRMSIGAHTLTHPVLSELPAERQEEEIRESKAAVEALLGQSVAAFSYPYGAYGPGTAEIVRRAGFACACATTPGGLRRAPDLYRLPRLTVEDCDGAAFARRLAMSG